MRCNIVQFRLVAGAQRSQVQSHNSPTTFLCHLKSASHLWCPVFQTQNSLWFMTLTFGPLARFLQEVSTILYVGQSARLDGRAPSNRPDTSTGALGKYVTTVLRWWIPLDDSSYVLYNIPHRLWLISHTGWACNVCKPEISGSNGETNGSV